MLFIEIHNFTGEKATRAVTERLRQLGFDLLLAVGDDYVFCNRSIDSSGTEVHMTFGSARQQAHGNIFSTFSRVN